MHLIVLRDLAPTRLEASEVIIRDKHQDPLVIAVELSDGTYLVAKRGDPDFNQTLEMLGLPLVRTDVIRGPQVSGLVLPD
jgi:hypothetical protein